jgi:hypothetical protein
VKFQLEFMKKRADRMEKELLEIELRHDEQDMQRVLKANTVKDK